MHSQNKNLHADVSIESLVGSITNEPRWVGRKGKIPYAVRATDGIALRTGCNQDHRAEWGTYREAIAASKEKGLDGIGVVLGGGLAGIDIDHIDARPEADTTVEEIVRLMDTYTEVSPSGNGIHLLLEISPETEETLSAFMNKNTKEGIEIYWTNRYFTFTGDVVNRQGVEHRDSQVVEFCKRFMNKRQIRLQSSEKTPTSAGSACLPEKRQRKKFDPPRGRADGTVIADACKYDGEFAQLYNGLWQSCRRASHSEADLALASRLAYWTGRDPMQIDRLFRQSGLMRGKWDENRGKKTYGDMTIEKALETDYTCGAYQRTARKRWRELQAERYRGRHGRS